MDGPSAISIGLAEAARLLADAVRLHGTLEAVGIEYQPEHAPLPRGVLSCGEACAVVSAVVGLVLTLYPQLADPDVLVDTVAASEVRDPTGAMN